jgi:hypothetical protein
LAHHQPPDNPKIYKAVTTKPPQISCQMALITKTILIIICHDTCFLSP